MLHGEEDAAQIDRQSAIVILDRDLGQRGGWTSTTSGVVEGGVQPPVGAERSRDELRHRRWIAHIGGNRQRLATRILNRARYLFQRLRVARGQRNGGASLGERPRGG